MIKRSAYVLALFALFIACLAASRPTSASVPAPVARPITARMVVESDPDDYIGLGGTYDFDSTEGKFFQVTSTSRGQVDYVHIYYNDNVNTWSLQFSTQRLSAPLLRGTYDNAERALTESVGHAGLDISAYHRGCNTISGAFTVQEALFDYSVDPPRIVRFAASFIQHCDAMEPKLTGTITFTGDPLDEWRLFLPQVITTQPRPLAPINPDR